MWASLILYSAFMVLAGWPLARWLNHVNDDPKDSVGLYTVVIVLWPLALFVAIIGLLAKAVSKL